MVSTEIQFPNFQKGLRFLVICRLQIGMLMHFLFFSQPVKYMTHVYTVIGTITNFPYTNKSGKRLYPYVKK